MITVININYKYLHCISTKIQKKEKNKESNHHENKLYTLSGVP